jgi:glycosyltransferase involved in cell wall biosynthesis
MRILFTVTGNGSRSNFVNGDTMRYNKAGLSGTDTTTILVAEYLAKMGNDVVIAVEESPEHLIKLREEKGYTFNPGKDVVNGVTYTYLPNLDGLVNTVFDVLINSLWFADYDKLNATITKSVCYWCHLAWGYYLRELTNYALKHNLSLGYINISKWAEGHHKDNIEFIKNTVPNHITTVIPNAMTTDVMSEILSKNIKREHKKVIFPAQWSRGGDVALKAVKKLGWESQFKSFDYINLSNGIDKETLFTELASSDYFIFPQYTPNGQVYKDVHSCAMAEAIGMGVVVVSYPLGSHEEYYGGHYFKLDFPPGTDMEKMMSERVTEAPYMNYTDNIVEKIKWIEENIELKEEIRNNGTPYILENFNIEKIGPMWVEFLNRL